MTEAKHTPGPWTIDADHDDDWSCYHDDAGTSCAKQIHADGRLVAFAAYHTHKLFGTKKEDAELQANARLISAAPEMLEALNLCRQHMYEHASNTPDDAFEKLCAAIAKATGN